MRFIFVTLCFVLVLSLDAQSLLSTPINLDRKNYDTQEILSTLKSQGINLAYSSDLLPNVQLRFVRSRLPLRSILNKLKSEIGIKHSISGTTVLLTYEKEDFTLSGTIQDNETGEALIGATVIIDQGKYGTTTNSYGFYSITLPRGNYEVAFSYVGYQEISDKITLNKNSNSMVKLNPVTEELEELVISSRPPEFNLENLIPGIHPINFGDKWPIPYFLGEQDIFQNSLTLPGIRSIGEDATGLNVRGGDTDQNLILLDEAPIYNPNHFYGLISVFNPEVVNSVDIMKGHFPPQFGGRASSVISIIQREGNNQEMHASGGIGLVSARMAVEGPIKKGESSYLLSARRSLLNFSIEDFLNASLDDSRTNFQDINFKINFSPNAENRFYVSFYTGRDRNRAGFDAIRSWGNRSLSLRWNRVLNPRLFSNITGVVSEYNYQIQDPQEVGSFIGESLIRDYSLKADFGFIINPANTIDFGTQSIFHFLKPGERQPFDENASTNPTILDNEEALETAIYVSHKSQITDRLSVQYGLRSTLLLNFGPGDVYSYETGEPRTDQSITDTLSYRSGQVFNRQLSWEPRFSLNYQTSTNSSVKLSYGQSYQFLHLISNTVSPSPTDIWKMSDKFIKPTISDHYSIGFYLNSQNRKWESTLETYFKTIHNVIEFKDGADLLFNENIETELLNGFGLSYGIEFFLKKNQGKFTGWLSYTLSRAEQRFTEQDESLRINNGDFFPTNFDKLHDLSLTGIYRLSPRISLSSNFNYSTGRPLTLPVGKYIFDGKIVPHFEDRNLYRLPDYHRLDLALRLNGKAIKRNGDQRKNTDYWLLTLYNVYSRRNVYSYFFRESETEEGQTQAIPYSIFRSIIPSVTYNFKF